MIIYGMLSILVKSNLSYSGLLRKANFRELSFLVIYSCLLSLAQSFLLKHGLSRTWEWHCWGWWSASSGKGATQTPGQILSTHGPWRGTGSMNSGARGDWNGPTCHLVPRAGMGKCASGSWNISIQHLSSQIRTSLMAFGLPGLHGEGRK